MKIFYAFVLLFLFYGCEESEDSENGRPSEFEVVIDTLGSTQVTISWSESFDPENETILYSVFLEGSEFGNNLTSRTFTFENLESNEMYTGQVIAIDPNGNQREVNFSFTMLSNQAPDEFQLISMSSTNVSISLSWEEAPDPDGDPVTYQIKLNNTVVAENISTFFYIIEGLEAAQTYNISIDAIDSEGNITSLEIETQTEDGIYDGDLNFITQESLDDFGELGYIEVTGDLELDALGGWESDITDISPLSTIKIVGGRFVIKFIDNLTNLSGLNIETVGSHFIIENNQNLQAIGDFSGLIHVYGDFIIRQNSNLQNITGFNNLETIGNIMRIHNNINLLNFEGFNNVDIINAIYINSNWLLENINAFNNLTKVNGDLSIENNPLVNTINGFNNLTEINRFYIQDTLVNNLDAFNALTKVYTEIRIYTNSQLNSISGLSSLTEVEFFDFSIGGNPQLTSLSGLENLTAVGNKFRIVANTSLNDFCALNPSLLNNISEFDIQISNNQYNPTLNQLLNENCSN